MRPLRYSINVTLDGCCDHRAIPADEELHQRAAGNLSQADALLFGRVTYEMMESAWRPAGPTVGRPEWMEPFAQTINAATSTWCRAPSSRSTGTLNSCRGIWAAPSGDSSGNRATGLLVGGVALPLALTELGLIDEYEFVVHPRLAGHGPTLFAGLSKYVDLQL